VSDSFEPKTGRRSRIFRPTLEIQAWKKRAIWSGGSLVIACQGRVDLGQRLLFLLKIPYFHQIWQSNKYSNRFFVSGWLACASPQTRQDLPVECAK
jgi:hypothetical protein